MQTAEYRRAYLAGWRARNREKVREQNANYRRANYRTIQGRSRQLRDVAVGRAVRANVPMTLTEAWIAERLHTGVCALTGLPFAMNNVGVMGAHSPSIDRIEPAKGYVPENCRMVIAAVNLAKNRWSDAVLYEWAEALLANRPTGETDR